MKRFIFIFLLLISFVLISSCNCNCGGSNNNVTVKLEGTYECVVNVTETYLVNKYTYTFNGNSYTKNSYYYTFYNDEYTLQKEETATGTYVLNSDNTKIDFTEEINPTQSQKTTYDIIIGTNENGNFFQLTRENENLVFYKK